MASMGKEITIRTAEYRPCLVNGRRALFHRWADSARPVTPRGLDETETDKRYQVWSVAAIVEFEDGTVTRAWPHDIKFADGGPSGEYHWNTERGDDDGLPFTFGSSEA